MVIPAAARAATVTRPTTIARNGSTQLLGLVPAKLVYSFPGERQANPSQQVRHVASPVVGQENPVSANLLIHSTSTISDSTMSDLGTSSRARPGPPLIGLHVLAQPPARGRALASQVTQRGDHSLGQVAREFDLTETAGREWVKQTDRDSGATQVWSHRGPGRFRLDGLGQPGQPSLQKPSR